MHPNTPGNDRSAIIYIPIIVFSVICPAVCAVRFWSRLRKTSGFGWDDYLILGSLAAALASSGLMIAACQHGFGQHMANLHPHNKLEALKWFYATQISYKASINLTKCSIILLFHRIFGKVRWVRWTCFVLATIIGLYGLGSVVATVVQCSPIEFAWNKGIQNGFCFDIMRFWYVNAGFSVGTDVVILAIPIPLVSRLQVPRIQKAALMLIFTLGGFVVITSCLRMTTINTAASSPDTTYDIYSTMWTLIEMNLAIVCACLPMARPLLACVFPGVFRTRAEDDSLHSPGSYDAVERKFWGGGKSAPSSPSYSDVHLSEWTNIVARQGVTLTTIGKGANGSQDCILEEGELPTPPPPARTRGSSVRSGSSSQQPRKGSLSIQKTVQYSVIYTPLEPGIHPLALMG